MKPKSERTAELHNNYIKGLFNNSTNTNKEDQPNLENLENTNNPLINNNHEFLLNKQIVKISQNSNNFSTKNNSVQLKTNIIINSDNNIDKNEWFKNRLIITKNLKEKKIIYCLESESDKNINKPKNILFAYKDNGFYIIYKYINVKKNYDKEIKAKIKWNMFSNHFKIYDSNNNIIEEIIYNFNFKGWMGPTKFQILIPFLKKNIMNGIGFNSNDKLFMHRMENKSPEYNSIYKCYVLNFVNRKVIPNENNIQIIYSDINEDKNNILLQFAQVGNDEYILDYKYPFNNITALALAMTNLSSRLFFK